MPLTKRTMSVQPSWCLLLPLQQQSVLLLAARGPDGVGKDHPCKPVVVAYRATVLVAAKYGRSLEWGEKADTFMSLDVFADDARWQQALKAWFGSLDSLQHHYLMHFIHGAQILGHKHPDPRFASRWLSFYLESCGDMHLLAESEPQLDERLGDWDREHWVL